MQPNPGGGGGNGGYGPGALAAAGGLGFVGGALVGHAYSQHDHHFNHQDPVPSHYETPALFSADTSGPATFAADSG